MRTHRGPGAKAVVPDEVEAALVCLFVIAAPFGSGGVGLAREWSAQWGSECEGTALQHTREFANQRLRLPLQ